MYLEKKQIIVHFNPEIQTARRIAAAITEEGYPANVTTVKKPPTGRTRTTQAKPKSRHTTGRLARTVLTVQGMVCTSCVDNIESNIGEVRGVHEIKVSLQEKCARISFNPKMTSVESLCERIEELGFDATPFEGADSYASAAKPAEVHVDITVEGMVCQSCVQNIEGNISEKKGVKEIKVSLKEKLATVTYDPQLTNPRRICDAIEDMGFSATPIITGVAIEDPSMDNDLISVIGVDGMTCHSCVSLIESGIEELAGVKSVRVSLEEKKATIVYDPSEANVETFKSSIEDMGFIVTGAQSKEMNNISIMLCLVHLKYFH